MELMRIARQKVNVRLLSVAAAGMWLAACAQSVVVEADFPTPLIEPLPVRMGLILGEDLNAFEHHEEIPQQATWTIQLGEANVAMLRPLFDTMFIETQSVTAVPLDAGDAARLDGVLKPTLEKFEFDVPLRTRDNFVEVWMQYMLTLYEPDGDVVIEWPVTGYGKSELEGSNREESVNRAAIVAMREAGATISTKFAEQPQVSYWLEERRNESALSAESRLSDQ